MRYLKGINKEGQMVFIKEYDELKDHFFKGKYKYEVRTLDGLNFDAVYNYETLISNRGIKITAVITEEEWNVYKDIQDITFTMYSITQQGFDDKFHKTSMEEYYNNLKKHINNYLKERK